MKRVLKGRGPLPLYIEGEGPQALTWCPKETLISLLFIKIFAQIIAFLSGFETIALRGAVGFSHPEVLAHVHSFFFLAFFFFFGGTFPQV